MFVTAALALTLSASPADVQLRPSTYPVNTKYSTGDVENFRELLVDGGALKGRLKPSAVPQLPRAEGEAAGPPPSFPPTGRLIVPNQTLSKVEVTIDDLHIGTLPALTDGVFHGLKTGTYHVTLEWPNGLKRTVDIATVAEAQHRGPAIP